MTCSVALATLASAALLAGCSSTSTPQPTAGGHPDAGPESKVCGLLTARQISAAVGDTFEHHDQPTSLGTTQACNWTGAGGSAAVEVLLHSDSGFDCLGESASDLRPVPGMNADACFIGSGGPGAQGSTSGAPLRVKTSSGVLDITVYRTNPPGGVDQLNQAEITLAKSALTHL
jgi:hypothetical protein